MFLEIKDFLNPEEVARLLDAAPPLTGEQRDTLALLLRRPRRR